MANNAGSVVDFLTSRGIQPQQGEQLPLFDLRKDVFGRLGLDADLGEFRGSGQQNTALLNRLQKAESEFGVSLSPDNFNEIVAGSARGISPSSVLGTASRQGADTSPTFTTPSGAVVDRATGDLISGPVGGDTPPPSLPTTGAEESTSAIPSNVLEGLPQTPGSQDIASQALAQVTGSATFPLQQEAQQAKKAAIRLQAEQKKEQFISNIASRGLFFSGAKSKGINTIEADKLAQVLGVDRKFALLIAQGLESAAQDIAKEAQAGRKEAIDSLGALGFAINPVTGKIEQTLSARRQGAESARSDARLELDAIAEGRLQSGEIRKQEQAEFSRRLQVEQLQISQNRLALDVTKEQRIAATSGELSPKDIQKNNEELAADIDAIIALGSREAAMEAINAQRFSVAIKYGESGMNAIQNAIDQTYPIQPPPGVAGPPASPGAAAVGEKIKAGGQSVGEFITKPFTETIIPQAASFLQGLGL